MSAALAADDEIAVSVLAQPGDAVVGGDAAVHDDEGAGRGLEGLEHAGEGAVLLDVAGEDLRAAHEAAGVEHQAQGEEGAVAVGGGRRRADGQRAARGRLHGSRRQPLTFAAVVENASVATVNTARGGGAVTPAVTLAVRGVAAGSTRVNVIATAATSGGTATAMIAVTVEAGPVNQPPAIFSRSSAHADPSPWVSARPACSTCRPGTRTRQRRPKDDVRQRVGVAVHRHR